MAYYSTSQSGNEEKTLAYDLRQLDAVLTSEIKRDLVQSKKNKDFYSWIKNIQDLYDQTHHYFKNYDATKEEYTKRLIEVKKVVNQHKNEFLGKGSKSDSIEAIETALRDFEQWIYKEMYDAGMFGFRYEDDGL